MQTLKVRDGAVVLIMNGAEAKALRSRLQQTGIKKSKPLLKVENKLDQEMMVQGWLCQRA